MKWLLLASAITLSTACTAAQGVAVKRLADPAVRLLCSFYTAPTVPIPDAGAP